MLRIAPFGEKIVQKDILKIYPPLRIFRFFLKKNEKCLELSDLARKLIRKKFPLVSMVGRAEGLACADPGTKTPIGASGNFPFFYWSECSECVQRSNLVRPLFLIINLFILLPPLLNFQQGLSGFKFLHVLLTNKNQISGKK